MKIYVFFSPFISLNNTPRRTSVRYDDDGDEYYEQEVEEDDGEMLYDGAEIENTIHYI